MGSLSASRRCFVLWDDESHGIKLRRAQLEHTKDRVEQDACDDADNETDEHCSNERVLFHGTR